MDHLCRKISPAKWQLADYMDEDDVGADAVTGPCLRTSSNSLSFWRCRQEQEDIAEVALALATEMNEPATIHVLVLPGTEVSERGIELSETRGRTAIDELAGRHVDAVHLTLRKVSVLASEVMAPSVRRDGGAAIATFRKKQVRESLCKAIKDGRLPLESLNEKMRRKLEKYLA